MIPEIHIEDYNYGLDEERIAKYPLPERDSTKLLHYKAGEKRVLWRKDVSKICRIFWNRTR